MTTSNSGAGPATTGAALGARYRRVLFFFARIIAELLFWEWALPRIGFRRQSRSSCPERLRRAAARFRVLALQMGGVLIKVGQFLSSRMDVLPPEILSEWPTFKTRYHQKILRRSRPWPKSSWELHWPTPLPGSTRCPWLPCHLDKCTEPSCSRVLPSRRQQGRSLTWSSRSSAQASSSWLKLISPHSSGWQAGYSDIGKCVGGPTFPGWWPSLRAPRCEELDYLCEGRNAETLAGNLAKLPGVQVPRVDWSHTTRCVLTLEDVYAIKITDYDAIAIAGIERVSVARRLFETYLHEFSKTASFMLILTRATSLWSTRTAPNAEDGCSHSSILAWWAASSPELRTGLRELLWPPPHAMRRGLFTPSKQSECCCPKLIWPC